MPRAPFSLPLALSLSLFSLVSSHSLAMHRHPATDAAAAAAGSRPLPLRDPLGYELLFCRSLSLCLSLSLCPMCEREFSCQTWSPANSCFPRRHRRSHSPTLTLHLSRGLHDRCKCPHKSSFRHHASLSSSPSRSLLSHAHTRPISLALSLARTASHALHYKISISQLLSFPLICYLSPLLPLLLRVSYRCCAAELSGPATHDRRPAQTTERSSLFTVRDELPSPCLGNRDCYCCCCRLFSCDDLFMCRKTCCAHQVAMRARHQRRAISR